MQENSAPSILPVFPPSIPLKERLPCLKPISHFHKSTPMPSVLDLRFYYESVEGHQVINDHVEEGKIKHENVHTAVTDRKKGDKTISRRQYLASDALGCSGYTDLVEEKDGIP